MGLINLYSSKQGSSGVMGLINLYSSKQVRQRIITPLQYCKTSHITWPCPWGGLASALLRSAGKERCNTNVVVDEA
mgnify:CR=1 FL=1